ncbi:chromate transporter [Mycoplasma sp. 'Moose RK']|uniref:chromate transporter n=1 Tax=Mycoplasma sp. 'Moose RK' TaxID=2780095 RepID=UPI0018C23B9C|nr:chromate transporter [Mycoplasma sp. 'Moose RK']MBG0730921.1 chromate transporter [Mycoplasma sp. 'Moose RK']
MIVLISVASAALILISLVVFGGGQIFMPVFSWFWLRLGDLGMKISETRIDEIFTIANSTPGVLSLKLAAATGFLIGGYGAVGWILTIFLMLVFSLPAIFLIASWLRIKKKYSQKNTIFWFNLAKILKPIITGIILALCFQIFTNLILVNYNFNTNGGYILSKKTDEFFQGWRFWVYISFAFFWTGASLVLYLKKVNVFLITIFGILLAFICLQPWI